MGVLNDIKQIVKDNFSHGRSEAANIKHISKVVIATVHGFGDDEILAINTIIKDMVARLKAKPSYSVYRYKLDSDYTPADIGYLSTVNDVLHAHPEVNRFSGKEETIMYTQGEIEGMEGEGVELFTLYLSFRDGGLEMMAYSVYKDKLITLGESLMKCRFDANGYKIKRKGFNYVAVRS